MQPNDTATSCLTCGSVILPRRQTDIRLFCSRGCYSLHRREHSLNSVEQRFWARVDYGDNCWLWAGSVQRNGYGRVRCFGQHRYTHVFAWRLATGQWPATGQVVCHTCDVRTCVRNDTVGVYTVDGVEYPRVGHLWLGTPAANAADMVAKMRSAAGDKNGSRLHPERRPRGDAHSARIHPERLARGDRNGSRLHPESRPRGADNYVHLHPEITRGENNGRATLTAALVRELRAYAAAGGNVSDFARLHGVGLNAAHKAVNRRTWTHI